MAEGAAAPAPAPAGSSRLDTSRAGMLSFIYLFNYANKYLKVDYAYEWETAGAEREADG